MPHFEDRQAGTAVLCSGGLDSAVLLADRARAGKTPVVPLYVQVGLAWEQEELAMLTRLLQSAPFPGVHPVVPLRFEMADVYPSSHWAIRGEPPAAHTPDEDVYLEGRNIVLLTKAAVYMARAGLGEVALGPLAGNPFPDATPEFFGAMEQALSRGLAAPIRISAPFAGLRKSDVIRLGLELGVPLELTISCMQPRKGIHCGRCSKCRERRDAFREARVDDPAEYAAADSRP